MGLSTYQQRVADSESRFRVAVFGRRGGKTTLAIREMIRFASKPNQTVWYVAPSYRMSKEIVWRKLSNKLVDLRWVAKRNESELTLYLKNGSIISLKGADNYDSLRGRAINFLVMDESADISPSTFYEVLRPALADTQGHALFCGTPKGRNWLYELFLNGSRNDDWESWRVSTEDAGFVTHDEIEESKGLLDERTFAQEFLADFVQSGSKIFYAFDPDSSVQPYRDPTPDIIHVGQDFNVGFMTAVCFDIKKDGTMHAFDEIVLTSSNTDEMVQELKNRYPRQKIFVYPDPSGRAAKSSASGKTDHSILANAGFIVKSPHKHNPVRDTINAVNSMLKSSSGDRRLFFDPSCKKTIESMDRWQYKDGSMIPEKNGAVDYSHLCDCVRYIVDYLNPVTKQFKPQPITRWGHKTTGVY